MLKNLDFWCEPVCVLDSDVSQPAACTALCSDRDETRQLADIASKGIRLIHRRGPHTADRLGPVLVFADFDRIHLHPRSHLHSNVLVASCLLPRPSTLCGGTSRRLGRGSFSAVSKRNFARKYAFDSIFQALQNLHTFAPLQTQNFNKKSV